MGDLDWPMVSGTAVKKPPWSACEVKLLAGRPHEKEALAVKSTSIFSGRERVQQGQEAGLGRCTWTLLIY